MKEPYNDEDLFAAALALPAAERGSYLMRACSNNVDLLERLMGLLEAFGDARSFVNEGAKTAQDGADRIGPYRLLQELGEGGCGVAYLAEQTAPVKRHVALKVIKPGMDTKAVIARFEAERQVLALMDHPNVAKVFDAGTTRQGRPYFVMELVRGIKITEYCDQCRLTVPERLSLFIQVCQAIQHAHQKGIIHRDIKPSNVLVTMHDGLPLAKVIDFGIAKATQGRLIDQTLHTAIDQLIGTPAYISPEQTEPSQAAVDTRSDIYSLGILLYELLTRHTPFDARELLQTSIERLRERIRTEEPPRPSRCLSGFDEELRARISIGSGTTPSKLVKQIEGDLDWIVMRCLEKEPGRRYQAVNELILDLDRYLRYEPVLARPPSLIYTVRKFARRNRVAFASTLAAAAFGVLITTFAIIMSIQAHRIGAERDRAKRVSNVVLNVLATADPLETFEHEIHRRDLLDQLSNSIQKELEWQPEVRARLLERLGIAYRRWDQIDKAISLLEQAVLIRRQLSPGNGSEIATAMLELATSLQSAGNDKQAQKILRDATTIVQRHRLDGSTVHARLLYVVGTSELVENRLPQARKYFEESLRLNRELLGARSIPVAECLHSLSRVFFWTDNLLEAEQTARESVSILETAPQSSESELILAKAQLAEILIHQNRFDVAEPLLMDVLRRQTQVIGRNTRHASDTLHLLARIKLLQGRLADAEDLERQALAAHRAARGDGHYDTAYFRAALALILTQRAKYADAEFELRQALEIFATTLPPDHQYIASAEYFLGEVLLATNRLSQAEAALTASMNRWKRSSAPNWRTARSASALGEALYRQGRTVEAKEYLSESFLELSTDPKAELAAKDKARERVARYLQGSPPAQRTDEPVQLISKRRT